MGLREIKRRASRHALINRDSFSTPKVPTGPPAAPPAEPMPDPIDSRLLALESHLYDMHARLRRTEDGYAYVNQKNMVLLEGMLRCHEVRLSAETQPVLANLGPSGTSSSQST